MNNIAEPIQLPVHGEAIAWLNDLIIDLKLQAEGYPPIKPITMERLHQWSKHRRDIERCVESCELKY